jgi:excisionase family DNA binding protein
MTEVPQSLKCIKVSEFANRTGLSLASAKRLVREGDIKIVRLTKRRIGIRESDLAAWMDARTNG